MLSELDQTQIPGTIHLHKLQVYKIALSFSLYSSMAHVYLNAHI